MLRPVGSNSNVYVGGVGLSTPKSSQAIKKKRKEEKNY
jgi:hypothetical protein